MSGPEVGKRLPRGAEAWVEDVKWHGYVLADSGHGSDWHRVFRLQPAQHEQLWGAIAGLAATAPVSDVRHTKHGVACEIRAELRFNGRRSTVVLAFFYDRAVDPPRLVTAHPVS